MLRFVSISHLQTNLFEKRVTRFGKQAYSTLAGKKKQGVNRLNLSIKNENFVHYARMIRASKALWR
jgi:hypothetical protein